MTPRHFEALASALSASRTNPVTVSSYGRRMVREQWRANVRAVAGVCQALNPSFDPAQFYERAGYDLEE